MDSDRLLIRSIIEQLGDDSANIQLRSGSRLTICIFSVGNGQVPDSVSTLNKIGIVQIQVA